MRIGICTTDFRGALPAGELFRKMADFGFETTQLAFSSVAECDFAASRQIEIPGFVSEEALQAIRSAVREYHIPVGAVNGTWNMAHADREIREEALLRWDGFLTAVAALDCPLVSLCSGSRSPVSLWSYDEATSSDAAWDDMMDSMRRATAMAEKHGITLAIETEASNVIHTPERARAVMDAVGSSNLKMILDCANLFHAGEASAANMRSAIDRAMKYFGKDVVLAHGKDIKPSDGITFCGTGFGIVDFPYMLDSLARAGYAGDMMLHGIYREEDMPTCLDFMRKCMNQ